MKTHNLRQGTPEWKAHRAEHFNASEAAAMMDADPNKKRSDLLFEKKTGIERDINSYVENVVFAKGHETEADARRILEGELNKDLYPETASAEIEGLPLGVSLDGIDDVDTVIFEHKQWNKVDAQKIIVTGKLEPKHYWQVEQALLITGVPLCIWVMSDGTEDNRVVVQYTPVRGRAKKLIKGWKQFQKDLEAYTPPETEKLQQVTAYEPPTLPAIKIDVSTALGEHNFDVFAERAAQFLESISTELETDQDFADAEVNVKACQAAENALQRAVDDVMSAGEEVTLLMTAVGNLRDKLRSTRLTLDKAVKSEKETRKRQIITAGQMHIENYCDSLMKDAAPCYQVHANPDFAGVTKGLRTLASIQDKVDAEVRRCKLEADDVAERVNQNREAVPEGSWSLFPDWAQIAEKSPGDFQLLVNSRLAAEKQRIEDVKAREKAQEAAQAAQSDEISPEGTTDAPPPLKTQNTSSQAPAPEKSFTGWWTDVGSGMAPAAGEDHEEHTRRVARAAWRAAQ